MVDTSAISARLAHLDGLLTELDAIRDGGRDAYTAYRGVFESLCPVGLDASLAERLAAAAGMRNILVRGYLDVDDEAVWNALGRLGDLRDFALTVQRIADSGHAGPEK